MSLKSKKQRRQHEKALVNAARLEIELLKKNIQPHFLMNTLIENGITHRKIEDRECRQDG